MMIKHPLVYTIGFCLAHSCLPVYAIEPGTLNPAKPSYQLPVLPSWQTTPLNENIQIERGEQLEKPQQSSDAQFRLKKLQFLGNKSITQKELNDIVKSLIGTVINRVDLENIR